MLSKGRNRRGQGLGIRDSGLGIGWGMFACGPQRERPKIHHRAHGGHREKHQRWHASKFSDSCSLTHRVSPGLLSVSSVISAMKIPAPKAPWSAVAAATALTYSAFAYVPYVPKPEGGSCCYRTPRRCAHFDLLWRAEGSWESVVKSFFLLIFAFWFFLAPWCLGGEALGAEYHGQVTFGGLAVPGATVTATQGDKQLATTTDPQGLYSFPDLADGKWTIEVRMTGFQQSSRMW